MELLDKPPAAVPLVGTIRGGACCGGVTPPCSLAALMIVQLVETV